MIHQDLNERSQVKSKRQREEVVVIKKKTLSHVCLQIMLKDEITISLTKQRVVNKTV